MAADGSLPDMPSTGVPMRAVVAAASTMNPDKEAQAQQLSQQTGMGVDLVRNNPQAAQQRATAADLDRRDMEIRNPILARQLQDPNFAGVAHDDLDSLSRIDEGAAQLRAYDPTWREKVSDAAQSAFEAIGGSGSLKQRVFDYPLSRVAIDALEGTESFAGNVGSFAGWHGNNPGGLNSLQIAARTLDPAAVGEQETGLDKGAQMLGPILPTMGIGAGASFIARTLGLSENAAKVLAAAGVGSAFSAEQGGATLTQMTGTGKSDAEARHAADVVAGMNLAPNVAMGLTDFLPFLKRSPLLSSVGMGAATGATGQLSQNLVMGQPWSTRLGSGALQGAAAMGGMHIGFAGLGGEADASGQTPEENTGTSFQQTMADLVDAAKSSKLRARSPEAFQSFANAQFEGDDSLRIPAQDFVNYFQEKKLDPALMANQVGATNLAEAATAGSDLEIPKANFFGRLDPEHQKGLLPDLIDPSTDLSARQAEAGKAELQDWMAKGGVEKLQAEYAQADAETQATPEWKQVYSDLKQRYVDAGETEPAADSYATLHANAIANLATRAGLKPDELLALHNPDIVSGSEGPQSMSASESPSSVLEREAGNRSQPVEGNTNPLYQSNAENLDVKRRAALGNSFEAINSYGQSFESIYGSEDWQEMSEDDRREAIEQDYNEAEEEETVERERQQRDHEHDEDLDSRVAYMDGKQHQVEDLLRKARLDYTVKGRLNYSRYISVDLPNDGSAEIRVSDHQPPAGRGGMKEGGADYYDAADVSLHPGDDAVEKVRSLLSEKGVNAFHAASPSGNVLYQEGKPDPLESVIDDPRLMDAVPRSVVEKLKKLAPAIASFASRPDEWNLLPGIRAAVARLGSVEREGDADNPVVDALARTLDGDPKAAQTAFKSYAHDADLNVSERANTTNDAYDAFNRAFGSKLTPEEFHNAVEEAAQRQNTASDADLSRVAAGDEGAGGEEPDGRNGAAGIGAGDESGAGSRSGTGEPATADERPADDGVNAKRGWFRMLPGGRYEIGKTKIGDFSTFIHEPAHAYLEMFRELTQREGASDALKDDFKKICDWLGTTPEEAYKNGFTTEQHEQWARANEQYAREGNAPTSGLTRAFHNFAVWLGSIYRRAGALGVELSSDIRGVMDRLYAGDDAVNRIEQERGQEAGQRLFDNPEEAGWTEDEYKKYAESKGLEVNEAKAQLWREMKDAALREKTQAWREEKGNVRDAVTQEIDARPEYTAIRSLRRGKLDDGTDLTLNRDALVSQFGEDRVKALQKLHPGLYRQEGGTDAETAAELFGYGSGEEMMRSLQATMRRTPAIEAATRDYLVNKYGDVRYDGTLNDRARFALENKEHAGNLYRELRALRERVAALQQRSAEAKTAMRSIAIEPLEHYQEAARQMIEGKAIADLQPNRYLNASRMFSREAFDAVRRGDAQRAAEAKNKELLNHFLFREASAARDYADKFASYAKRMQSRGIQQRLGLADVQSGMDYRDQFNWLLARYKLGPAVQAPERSLRAWAEDVYGQGNEPAIAPGILNEGRFGDYRNVPLSEVRDLHDALVNVRHLAMQEFKMYVQGKQVDFAEAKSAMIESARENLRVKPEKIFDENRSGADRIGSVAQRGDALLVRMERMVEWLDGGKSGPWHDNVWNLASDAQGDEYTMQHDVTRTVTDALADMPAEMRKRLWMDKVTVDGVGEPLSRRRMLAIAFNMGNEGNLDRLKKTFASFGWDPDAVQRIGGMLTREEWGFVQKAWDSLKPLGERMREMETRLTGLPPSMVKVTPFKVALDDGTEMDLAGGYYPIKMDPRFSDKGMQQEAKETAQNAMQSGYVRAATSKGYTKERTGFGGPLDLDYERVLTDHVAKVAKDLSHREFMLSTQRLLLDTEVRKTLRETLGPAYEAQFMPWLRTIINDRNGSVQQGLGDLSNMMQTLRGNMVAASIGFKVSTSLLQITHAPRMLLYARPGSIAQSLVDFLARPLEMTRENRELSPNEMRFRGDNLDRDVRAVLREPSYKEGFTKKAAMAARFTLATVDHLFSHTLWRAAYRDGLQKYADLPEGEAQSNAAHEADSAVRLGLGTSAPKDLPAIMRNNDFNKMITILYGFHNGVYNQLRDNAHQARFGGGSLGGRVGKLTYATALTAIVPALLGALVTGDGPKDGENPALWAAKRALLFSADTIPLLGSLANVIVEGRDMKFTPLENMFDKGGKAMLHAATPKDEKDWLGIGLDAAESGGEMLGVPGSGQAVKTLRYMKRTNEGKVENPNWWGALAGGG
jgi:hypothetical protein